MFLKAKKKRYLTVTCHEAVLYEGYWTELPLAEEIILEKSIEFFNDKEPCAIHRGAAPSGRIGAAFLIFRFPKPVLSLHRFSFRLQHSVFRKVTVPTA